MRRPRFVFVVVLLFAILFFSRSIASLILDYHWWQEVGQLSTWYRMMEYRYLPGIAGWIILWAILWVAHARGMKYAETRLRDYPVYGRLMTLALGFLALILALSTVDGWTIARYFGGTNVTAGWQDPVFGKSLGFYFFNLPFYRDLIGFVLAAAASAGLVYYATARLWQIRIRFPSLWASGRLEWDDLRMLGRLESNLVHILLAIFLLGLAVTFWLGRYELLYSDHGDLMVGLNYVDENLRLPLQIAQAAAAVLAAILVLMRRPKLAIATAAILIVNWFLPPLVSALYVRPNELSLERPYLQRHIEATRHGFGLDAGVTETTFQAKREAPIDLEKNRALLNNVRLWDWRAFHDTISQTQPLRPYTYADSDIDRYTIDGRLRQVLLAPRELEINQLGAAGQSWVNSRLTFTHGYGLVLAETSKITPDGLPELLIKDAPVEVLTPSLKVTRPEIYFSEAAHEPVFVRTRQSEFNYPSGSSDVANRYDGHGGFLIGSTLLRLAATLAYGDWNISLSNDFTSESRMMIHRELPNRLGTLAPFITWDSDPYLVITDAGRLVWIVDGYITSDLQPYARSVTSDEGSYNYIRNSVKATVDAYQGDVRFYVFDPQDPMIQAYQNLFPALLHPVSEMPADLRAHARAPEGLFRAQAEIFRTYHMRDPESYYNRADQWDYATYSTGQGGRPAPVEPTYLIATLPGEMQPETLLTMPFTPRNKQNLIALMATRNDGDKLGQVVFLQLPKQEIIPGPLQVDALINQDEFISKDLSLWNQQGSQVLRTQILTLPIDNTFLYIAPIYIQASQARMPQLKKIALAVGSTLVYADNYEQGLQRLAAELRGSAPPPTAPETPSTPSTSAAPAPGADPRISQIRDHLDRYRTLVSQGRWSEAGKELEAVENLVKR